MNPFSICFGIVLLLSIDACSFTLLVAAPAPRSNIQPIVQLGRWSDSETLINDVAVAGRYAYAAARSKGIQVFDLGNPLGPIPVGGYNFDPDDDPGADATDIVVQNGVAYVAAGASLMIFSLLESDIARLDDGIFLPAFGGGRGNVSGVAVAGSYAYVTDFGGWPTFLGGLHVLDVSDTEDPDLVGNCPTLDQPVDVVVSGKYAYVSSFYGLEIVDVSSPTNCVRVGGYPTSTSGLALCPSGKYIYCGSGKVIDVRDPTNCVLAGVFSAKDADVADVAVIGKNLVLSAEGLGSGLWVFDISNETNCVLVTHISMPEELLGLSIFDGRICAAAFNDGLVVFPSIRNIQQTLRIDATPNLPFTLEAATNLSDLNSWQPLLTTNVATMPFDFVDFDVKNADKPQKFYRVRQ